MLAVEHIGASTLDAFEPPPDKTLGIASLPTFAAGHTGVHIDPAGRQSANTTAPGAGHLFANPDGPDYDPALADEMLSANSASPRSPNANPEVAVKSTSPGCFPQAREQASSRSRAHCSFHKPASVSPTAEPGSVSAAPGSGTTRSSRVLTAQSRRGQQSRRRCYVGDRGEEVG